MSTEPHLIDTNRREDAYSIGQEYVCKGEVNGDYHGFLQLSIQIEEQITWIIMKFADYMIIYKTS